MNEVEERLETGSSWTRHTKPAESPTSDKLNIMTGSTLVDGMGWLAVFCFLTAILTPIIAMSTSPQEHDLSDTEKFQTPEISGARKEFLLAEYQRLCSEIAIYIGESSECAKFAITASAAVWVWLLNDGSWRTGGGAALLIPALITFGFGTKWLALQRSMGEIGRYLKKLEGEFNPGAGLGWETHIREDRSPSNRDQTSVETATGRRPFASQGQQHAWFFGIFLILNVTAGVFILCSNVGTKESQKIQGIEPQKVSDAIKSLTDVLTQQTKH